MRRLFNHCRPSRPSPVLSNHVEHRKKRSSRNRLYTTGSWRTLMQQHSRVRSIYQNGSITVENLVLKRYTVGSCCSSSRAIGLLRCCAVVRLFNCLEGHPNSPQLADADADSVLDSSLLCFLPGAGSGSRWKRERAGLVAVGVKRKFSRYKSCIFQLCPDRITTQHFWFRHQAKRLTAELLFRQIRRGSIELYLREDMKIVQWVCFGILLIYGLSPVLSDDSVEVWSCSPDTTDVSELYGQKVQEVLDAIEVDIMTHGSWDLMCQTTGDGDQDVVGSAGCIPSKDMKNMEDCFACIVSARAHLGERCPRKLRGAVFLNSCTLMYARMERTSVDDEWEDMDPMVDDGHLTGKWADS